MRKEALAILILLGISFGVALAENELILHSPSQSYYTSNLLELNISFTANITDLNLKLDGADSVLCQNCSILYNSTNSYFTLLNLSDGLHTLFITGTDGMGENITHNRTFFIDTPPTSLLVSPVNLITNLTTHIFICNSSDSIGLSDLTLYLFNVTGEFFVNTTTPVSNGQVNWTYNLPINGNYTWNCLAKDSFNNTDWDNNRTLVIDTVPPTSFSFSCSPSSIPKGEATTCVCSAMDITSGIASYSFPSSPSTSGNGTFQINCTATDYAGNSYTGTTSYTVTQPESSSQQQTTQQSTTGNKISNFTVQNVTNTTTTNQTKNTSAITAEFVVPLGENTTDIVTGEIQEPDLVGSESGITGAFIDVGSRLNNPTFIATVSFIGIILFMASFVTFIRKKVVRRSKIPIKTKISHKNRKFRKSTILE